MTTESRLRKVCPVCFSLNVGKNKKHGAYRCKSCKAIFISPALKEFKVKNNISEHLMKILKKKREEAVTGDID